MHIIHCSGGLWLTLPATNLVENSVVKTYVTYMSKHSICCTFMASCVVVVVVVAIFLKMCGCGCSCGQTKTAIVVVVVVVVIF